MKAGPRTAVRSLDVRPPHPFGFVSAHPAGEGGDDLELGGGVHRPVRALGKY